MSAPTVRVEVAFSTAPLTVPGAWTDISAYVRAIDISRGRDHELGQSQAGECAIRLRNTDRRFDPLNTAGPYYPNILPMRQVRVVATLDAVDYPLFYGYVENWDQTWPTRPVASAGDAECVLEAADGFKVLSLYQLRNTYATEVLSDAPLGYWKLDERAGETVLVDSAGTAAGSGPAGAPEFVSGGEKHDLEVLTTGATGVTMGVTPGPLIGGSGAMSCVGLTGEPSGFTGAASTEYAGMSGVNVLLNPVLELWIKPRTFVASRVYASFHDAGGIIAAQIRNNGTTGKIEWVQYSGGTFLSQPTFTLTANVWTHIVAVHDYLSVDWYVNGVFVERTATGGAGAHSLFTTPPKMYVGGTRNSSSQPDALIDHVALYDQSYESPGFALRKFSPTRIAAHYAAIYGSIGPGTAGAQTTTLLDMVGWPAGLRSIDTSETQMQSFDPQGSALEHLLRVCEDSERGLLQMSNDGKVTFHSRDSLELTTGSHGVSQATYGDAGGAELAYADLELSYDDQDLWTRVIVTRDGGAPQFEEDATASAAYGPRTLSVSASSLEADLAADAIARFLLQSYRRPSVRPVSVRMVLGSDSTLNAAVLGRDTHHDRVTVTRSPPGGGSALSLAAHVEGISWDIVPGQPWEAELRLVPDNGVTIVADGCVGGTLPVPATQTTSTLGLNQVTALTTSTTLTTTSWGPEPAGTTFYYMVINKKATTPDIPTMAGTNAHNVTYTQRGTWLDSTGLRRMTLFSATEVGVGAAGTVTATFANPQTGGYMVAAETVLSNGGLAAEAPAQIVHATGTGTAPLATLAALTAASTTIGFLSSAATSGTVTAGSGYTASSHILAATGATSYEKRTANVGDTAVGFTTSVSATWQVVGVELAATPAAVPGVLPTLNGTSESSSGAGAVAQPSATAYAEHPGVISLETGTTATGRSALIGAADVIQLGALECFARMTVRVPTNLSTAGETFTLRHGIGDSASAESVDFVGFRYTHSVNGGKWQAVCRSNSVETAVDTGKLVAVDTFYDLGFIVNPAGTSVSFTIDGIVVGSAITTNIPTGAARKLTYLPAFILKSAGTTTRSVLLDRYAYVIGP